MTDRMTPASLEEFVSRDETPHNAAAVAPDMPCTRHVNRRRARAAVTSRARANATDRPATRSGAAKWERKRYAAAATSAFEYCERSVAQLRTVVAIAATILRAPPLTADDRRSQRTMLELLLDTAEGYQHMAEEDRTLFEVLVLDARGIEATEMTATEAIRLLNAKGKQAEHAPA
jgi:hypothetical protein